MSIVIYRGVLQRSRLRLLLAALGDDGEPNRFVWISTRPTDKEQIGRLLDVLDAVPVEYDWEIVDGSLTSLLTARRRVSRLLDGSSCRVGVIGESALAYLPNSRSPVTLCVNGIPEERLLHRSGILSRLRTSAAWVVYRAAMRPRKGSVSITVSTRMSSLVNRRLGVTSTIEAPTAAGEEYFGLDLTAPERREFDFCYQGSGAVWQNLPHLNAVWCSIAERRPESRFLVLSYDRRCRVLADDMPTGSVEFVEAFQPDDVARQLARCRIGFVLRTPDLVNRVSFPTKIGESLACGVALVLTDIGWDPGDLLAGNPIARIVAADSTPDSTARASLDLLDALPEDAPELCRDAAQHLRRDRLVTVVRSALEETGRHVRS